MIDRVSEIKALPHYREPVVGEEVCVGTSLYLSHGHDDFHGGMCKIARIIDRRDEDSKALDINRLSVEVEERPGWETNWYILMEREPENIERYGDGRGYRDPDDRPSMNEGWNA